MEKQPKKKIRKATDDFGNEIKTHVDVILQKLTDQFESLVKSESEIVEKKKEKEESFKNEYSTF